jgi:hypothetical protein
MSGIVVLVYQLVAVTVDCASSLVRYWHSDREFLEREGLRNCGEMLLVMA